MKEIPTGGDVRVSGNSIVKARNAAWVGVLFSEHAAADRGIGEHIWVFAPKSMQSTGI